jgi:hypothetical protein
MDNPFHGPKATRRLSAKAIVTAAEQTNALLREGKRLFNYPIGIAGPVIDELEASGEGGEPGWIVEVQKVTDTDVTILLRDPECRFSKPKGGA